MPRRLVLLAAKAVNVAGLTLVAGCLAVAGCLLAGRLLLPGAGLDAAHGYALVSITHGPTLRAAVGSVAYLVLVALLGLGAATAIRDTAVSIGAVLALLYLPPSWPRRHRTATTTHTADRPYDRRAGHPSHHRPPLPSYRPVGRPGRPRRMGSRFPRRRGEAVTTPRCMSSRLLS